MFRRGKLIFLNTKDDRVKVINERIDLTEKHLIVLCQSFAACARRLAKYRDSYDALSQILLNYAEEEEINNSLIGGLKNSANAVTLLGDYMDLKAQRMDLKIVNELAQFENLCKSTRDNLRTAIMARDKEVLKQKQMLEIKAKFSTNNEAADSELFKAKMEVNRRNKEIDDIINNFEKHKLSDLKTILFDFILITMKYHVKSLEVLTANYHDLNRVDEKDDLRIFRRFLRKKWDNQDIIKKKRGNGNLRSQSLDSLDRDQSLSPFKIDRKKSSSIKNLTDTEQDRDNVDYDDDDDDDDDDGEDDDDVDISESEKNDTEENDTEEEDNKESVESEDSDAVKTDDDSHNTHKNKNEAKEGHIKNENLKIKKHPFNALPATNISKHLESIIIKQPQETASTRLTRATTVTSSHQSGKTNHNKFSVSKSISKDKNRKDKSRRQVTVVESKRSAENSQQADAVIDCTKALRI